MSDKTIKQYVREGLISMLREKDKNIPTQNTNAETGEDTNHGKTPNKNTRKDYGDVQNYFTKDLAFSQVDVMKKALGWEDDETGTNRSLFGKMLHQEKNDEGGLYQFNNQQIDRIRTAIKLK